MLESSRNVPCPFCGLGCDDLVLRPRGTAFAVESGGCARSAAGFGREIGEIQARVNGRPVAVAEAVAEAARLLGASAQPVIGGLATDVDGVRAALRLGKRCDAALDHLHGDAGFQGILAMQSSGGMTTTLSELKNRARLVVLVGDVGNDVLPHLAERFLASGKGAFLGDSPRRVVAIGPHAPPADASKHAEWEHIACEAELLPYAIGALRCLVEGRELDATAGDRLPMDRLAALAGAIPEADYGAVVWGGTGLGAHGDLLVEALQTLVQSLNAERRWGGVAIGGTEGASTMEEVCTWNTGYPGRIRFRAGDVIYEPRLLDMQRMLDSGEADCLLWVGGLEGEHGPPATDVSSIVLAPADTPLACEPAVFLPVGIPGIDHSGTAVRCDHVVSLPLRKLREGGAPSAATVLGEILRALGEKEVPAC